MCNIFIVNKLFDLEINGLENTRISLLPKDALIQLEQKDKIGFDIGRDWAFYHQSLPDNADAAIYRGHKSNQAHPPGRKEVDRFTKKWLQIRYHAYLRNRPVADDVDIALIKLLDRPKCIITGVTLTHGSLSPSDWSVERLCNTAGYAWGNLVIESQLANEARGSMTYEEIHLATKSKRATNGLSPQFWSHYEAMARGPNFWAGHVKGITPIAFPTPRLVFFVPSHCLMEMVYWSVCHKDEKVRINAHRGMKHFSKSEPAMDNLRKLRAKIERKYQAQFRIGNIFQNGSCFEAFLRWYESSTITFDMYKEMVHGERYPKIKIEGSKTDNPLDEWWIATEGRLY
jgi:hypothetical protein